MHIQPGLVASSKIIVANITLISVLAYALKEALATPSHLVKSFLAALFFTLFMQTFHVNVGPSELHFLGAMPIYLLFGLVPTMIGFAVGLLFQGLLFEPTDLVHLSVNSLSLIVPLVALHMSMGEKLLNQPLRNRIKWSNILKMDAVYYSGVVSMVGFWLLLGTADGLVSTTLAGFLTFAASYMAVIAFEPLFTYTILSFAKKYEDNSFLSRFTQINKLRLS
jgi:ABC-type Co2+ transport system permease subunit